MRIYDPDGHAKPEVTLADIVRSSVVAFRDPAMKKQAGVSFDLTREGNRKFHLLTLALARRGARLHRLQHAAFAVNGHVITRPYIDYKQFPDGLDPSGSGLIISGMSFKEAKTLATQMRSG